MPVLQPAEAWEKTGRYAIDELFKLEDRKGAPMVLAMTHEECVTHHVAREVRSYRDLPLMLFHIQTKERDEPRPRAGVLRTREFTMKDAYSFDRDEEGLARSYELQSEAYERIFDRCGLRWYRVESDVGMMGGSGAHEYMAPCPPGRTRSRSPPATPPTSRSPRPRPSRSSCRRRWTRPRRSRPRAWPRSRRSPARSACPAGALIKALPVVSRGAGMALVLLRGDHRLNEIKLRNALGADFRQARRGGDRGRARPGRLHRPGRRECRSSRTPRSTATPSSPAPTRADTHLRGVQARPRLRVRGARRAHGRGRRHRPRRRHDRDRAGDRDRQHLQARHPLLRAARRHLPRRGRGRSDRS